MTIPHLRITHHRGLSAYEFFEVSDGGVYRRSVLTGRWEKAHGQDWLGVTAEAQVLALESALRDSRPN